LRADGRDTHRKAAATKNGWKTTAKQTAGHDELEKASGPFIARHLRPPPLFGQLKPATSATPSVGRPVVGELMRP
jgi:hypothetical protein